MFIVPHHRWQMSVTLSVFYLNTLKVPYSNKVAAALVNKFRPCLVKIWSQLLRPNHISCGKSFLLQYCSLIKTKLSLNKQKQEEKVTYFGTNRVFPYQIRLLIILIIIFIIIIIKGIVKKIQCLHQMYIILRCIQQINTDFYANCCFKGT